MYHTSSKGFQSIYHICKSINFYKKSCYELYKINRGPVWICSQHASTAGAQGQGPIDVYAARVAAGTLRHDIHQESIAVQLHDIYNKV